MMSKVSEALSALKLLHYVQKDDWSLVDIENMYLKAVEMLEGFDLESSPFANHNNPLFLAVALSEACQHMSKFCLEFQTKFQVLTLRFRQLAEKIQSQFTDYRVVEILYTERIYGNECLFDVLTRSTEQYRSLLCSHTVVAVAQHLWDGGSQFESNFERMCPATLLLGTEGQEPFQVHRAEKKFTLSIFRLSEWKRNNTLKFIVEAIGLILTFFTMMVNLVCYTSVAQQLRDPDLLLPDRISLANDVDAIGRFSITYNTFIWLMLLYLLQIWNYVYITGGSIIVQMKDVMDCLLFALALLNAILNNRTFQLDLTPKELRAIAEPSFGLVFLVTGFRMLLTLLITRSFGPMIRMVFIVMKDVGVFLCIFLVALVSFGVLAHCLFYIEPEFSDVFLSLRTLYQWSLSGVDFSVFSVRTDWGSVVGVVWMFVSAIILLNLLIAVLSVRYEELAPQCTADYVSAVYRQYSLTHYQEPYGALVMAPAPLTFLTLPLTPLYFFCPRSAKRINTAFVILTYQPFFMLGLLLFVIYTISYSIIAYFYAAANLARRFKWLKLILWLTLGPGYLIWLGLSSLIAYTRLMYEADPPKMECLPIEVLHPVIKFLSTLRVFPVLQTEDLRAILAKFPIRSSEKVTVRERAFSAVLTRVIPSQNRLSTIKRSQIKSLFEQFKSYRGTEEDEDKGMIDLGRMARIIKMYSARPDKLAAINIYSTQKALTLLETEYTLKKRKGKSLS